MLSAIVTFLLPHPTPSSPPPLADCEAATRRRDEVARTAHEHSTVLDGVDMVLQQVLGVFEATQFESAQHARYVLFEYL
jgi:hypothetical protein